MVTDWNAWLDTAEIMDIDGERGPGFNHSNHVIQAAIDGQGVALGRSVLIADALARGDLVPPSRSASLLLTLITWFAPNR